MLTWAAPTITTGLPVTSYTVKRNNGTLSADVSVAVVCGGTALATTCNVSGLEGGRVYDLQVSATSLAGEGFYSTSLPVATAPAAVSASSVSGSLMTSTSMSLTWEEPVTAAGGMPPSGYIVYRNDGGSTPVTTVAYEGRGSTARVANISGLSGGVTYSFQVAAVSDAGQGDSSGVFMQSTAPAAPTALNTTGQTASTIGLAWTAPVNSGGAEVTEYRVYRNDGTADGAVTIMVNATVTSIAADVNSTVSSPAVSVDGLESGRLYVFQVSAVNAAGEGVRSVSFAQSTVSSAPGVAQSLHQSSSTIRLDWSAPNVTTGAAVSGYRVYDESTIPTPVAPVYEGVASAAEIAGLNASTAYAFTVTALSAAGESVKLPLRCSQRRQRLRQVSAARRD